ncbi:DUF4302 domain-containing protein [[Flexibacter] sp. ATCC 35208]|uniref:DUF4302 domain-containing protein n=1 Tax=[Flexibacter] sp. ATCC 35208 TaxID=1936242 RepID=UPI001F41BDF6|nr:DUF4302 domain-containing protein [[Flexibacter] sp. ATCC 35208]
MMRKSLLYICLIISALSACHKAEDDVFGNSPDNRLNDTLARYQSMLTSATHGWKMIIAPAGMDGGTYSFYMQFNDSNRVKMLADFDAVSSVTLKESSYRLKALQQTCLLFDTYSYLHELADPDGAVNGGVYGEGLYSDFEFILDGIRADTIQLTGRYHESKAFLVAATAAEEAAYLGTPQKNDIDSISKFLTYFKRLTIGEQAFDFTINFSSRNAIVNWIDAAGASHSVNIGFYPTPGGIAFYPAITVGDMVITGFDNVKFNAANTTLSLTVNGTAATIAETAKPLVVDKTLPKKWYDAIVATGSYSSNYTGFHVNGVNDGLDFAALPNYYFLIFYPKYGGGSYDLLGFVTLESDGATLSYAPAFKAPTFTDDGRIKFTYYGFFGTAPDGETAVTAARTLFADTNGYYLVQTTSTSYDMVSAKDGKTWITWY